MRVAWRLFLSGIGHVLIYAGAPRPIKHDVVKPLDAISCFGFAFRIRLALQLGRLNVRWIHMVVNLSHTVQVEGVSRGGRIVHTL